MAESMTQEDDVVEDFFDRISWVPVNEAAGLESVNAEHSEGEKTDVSLSAHCWGASQQNPAPQQNPEIESHRRSLAEICHDQDEGPAPTRRCIRSDQAPLVVQRPIPFIATSISFDAGEQRYRLELDDTDWYNHILERYADAGYGPRSDSLGSVASIVGIFQSLPPDLADVLKEGLHALQVLRAARATSRRPHAAAAPVDEGTGRFAAMEDDMWERNNECGYLRFEWDPATERRRHAVVNSTLARMQGMHPEEMVARIGRREASLGVRSELDFLCIMLNDFLSLGAERATYYARLSPAAPAPAPHASASAADPHGRFFGGAGAGGGGGRGAFLARVTTVKMFDSSGQLWQVKHFIQAVDADEYDQAVAADSQLGRPFAAALGDNRPGRQLLAEQAADSRPAAATLAGLRATAAGRRLLSLLAEEARRRFAPVVAAAAALVHALPSRSPSPCAASGSDSE